MKNFVMALVGWVPLAASAQCFGPGGCGTDPPPHPGPTQICIGAVCTPVEYHVMDRFVIASAALPGTGYVQLGWSGPCAGDDLLACPGVWTQAAQDLEVNLLRVNRFLK